MNFKSDAYEAIHSTMTGLAEIGAIDKVTMRSFDRSCLVPEFSPEQIKSLRRKAAVSQAVFAHNLNVSLSLVRQWERGTKRPSGAARKLLSLVDRHGISILAE